METSRLARSLDINLKPPNKPLVLADRWTDGKEKFTRVSPERKTHRTGRVQVEVRGQRSAARGQRSAGRGQRSEVRREKSEGRSQNIGLQISLLPPTSRNNGLATRRPARASDRLPFRRSPTRKRKAVRDRKR